MSTNLCKTEANINSQDDKPHKDDDKYHNDKYHNDKYHNDKYHNGKYHIDKYHNDISLGVYGIDVKYSLSKLIKENCINNGLPKNIIFMMNCSHAPIFPNNVVSTN
jgi:hypothetical protein